jgi:MoaA/NifB/PqqE/SkfB family radical SAM enzyme
MRDPSDSRTQHGGIVQFSIDIELTNRCNAKCHFCPRDQTPHEGVMTREVFDQSLARAVEYRHLASDALGSDGESVVSLCGLGEPLLNKHAPEFVRKVRDAGFTVSMSSNGALLNETRGRALLDAGLQRILINVGEEGDDYNSVYKLPFEKTRDNVVQFAEAARDHCEVYIVLVDHRRDKGHIAKMREFWKRNGVALFYEYEVMNRGGALFVDHMQFETYPQLTRAREMLDKRGLTPTCGAPFGYLFVGYDGQYYLCCSDWKKETPMGSVFDESFRSVMEQKLQHVLTREPVCKTCNLDPLNILTEQLRAVDEGAAPDSAVVDALTRVSEGSRATQRVLDAFEVAVPPPSVAKPRRRLSVRSV